MPSIETSIWLALRARVETLVLSPAIPIIWPGEGTSIPTGNSIEVTHFPNRTNRLFINSGKHQYQGILQLGLLTVPGPAHHETVAREIAGTIAAHFPADLRLAYSSISVRITKRPDVSRGLRDTERSRWLTPVSIYYECFA